MKYRADEVGVITWRGPHTPEITWSEVARLPTTATAEDVQRARHRLLERRKFFVVCSECGHRTPKGCTHDGLCHGCMERNHGVVF